MNDSAVQNRVADLPRWACRQGDCEVYKGHVVDVLGREVFDGEVVVKDGIIADVRRCETTVEAKHASHCNSADKATALPYLLPGFIDSHVHIESSLLVPSQYARMAVRHGTIGVVTDPHEIANVLGVEGVEYMIDESRQALFNFNFGAPSCVPCCGGGIETAGATIDAEAIERLLARDDIGFLSEMMNYPGVLLAHEEVMRKIAAAHRVGKPVDGHAPGLLGDDRRRYAAAGISTDHECSTLQEGLSCIENGMMVLIREGSAAKDYAQLIPLLAKYPSEVMFCTDDHAPEDLVHGHINLIVRRAMAEGYNVWDILQAASVNPQRHYGLQWGLLQVGDPATFIAVSSMEPDFEILQTVIVGRQAYPCGDATAHNDACPNRFEATPLTLNDIRTERGTMEHIICASDGSLYTRHEIATQDQPYPWHEVQKMVVLNRYQRGIKPAVGWIRGFNLRGGAIAASVAHDCHNIVGIGSDDEMLLRAINRVVEMKGGEVVVCGNEMAELPLPVAGLMSPLDGHEVAHRCEQIADLVRRAGCTMRAPFITMPLMCLPVIPEIKLTDRHLWDSLHMQVIQ